MFSENGHKIHKERLNYMICYRGGGGGGTCLEGGGPFPGILMSCLKWNCRKNCFVSVFHSVQNLSSDFSTSLLGIWRRELPWQLKLMAEKSER